VVRIHRSMALEAEDQCKPVLAGEVRPFQLTSPKSLGHNNRITVFHRLPASMPEDVDAVVAKAEAILEEGEVYKGEEAELS